MNDIKFYMSPCRIEFLALDAMHLSQKKGAFARCIC